MKRLSKPLATLLTGWLVAVLPVTPAVADEPMWTVNGSVGIETRWFPDQPRWPGQDDGIGLSLFSNLEFRWRGERQRIYIEPFSRIDRLDDDRSHWDLREAYWAYEADDWELLAGASRVFWGVTESRHLVDIVNQTDLVEDPDGEQKLGQQMIRLSFFREWGDLEFFLLPGFRERTFPGPDGRLRPPLPIDTDQPVYESSANSSHVDTAIRWSHYFGAVDVGISVFHGTGRNPKLTPADNGASLIPFYHQVSQAGLDLQYTGDAWLWKTEAIVRKGINDTFFASVSGFEYTLYGVNDSDADLGLLVEYLYDGRGPDEPATTLENDIFLGSRLALNDPYDTSLLAGLVVDVESQEWFFNLEAERRWRENWLLEGRLRIFNGKPGVNQLYAFDRDDYVQISLVRYF